MKRNPVNVFLRTPQENMYIRLGVTRGHHKGDSSSAEVTRNTNDSREQSALRGKSFKKDNLTYGASARGFT